MFEEYDEQVIRENPNLEFGDGKCPGFNYIISSDHQCPSNCKYHEEIGLCED
jgi:hypothetical protein